MNKAKRTRIVEVKAADENHQVLSIESSSRGYMRKPCPTCPWRKDAKIGAFPAEAYRHSAGTAYDQSRKMFSCHSAGAQHPKTCAGFLLRGADDNIAARISQMVGIIDMSKVSDNGLELYPDYFAMAVANGVGTDEEVLSKVMRYPDQSTT